MASEPIRNVALVGHRGNGKTTLAEAMLFAAGVVARPGRVENGNTVLGSTPEERDRVQSLALGVATFTWGEHQINLIDTPGYADFAGDAITALRVADVAVFVVDGVSGIQVNDELLWKAAANLSKPRLVFINKLDKQRASFESTLADVREHFGPGVELVELPVGGEAMTGVADLLTDHVYLYDAGTVVDSDEVPPDIADREHEEHEHLVEDVVEIEDDLLMRYLDGEKIAVAELEHALHTGFAGGALWPVLCGSAGDGIAVDRLLEFICRIGPTPTDVPGIEVVAGAISGPAAGNPSGDPLAYVFKTQSDEYVGQLALLKVLSGTLHADDVLVNPRTGGKERLHHLLRVVGTKHTAIDTAVAGDIVGAIKLTDVVTGDALAPVGTSLTVAPTAHAQPVHGIAVAAQSVGDEDKLATALAELVSDDPTLEVTRDPDTHQTVLRGAGEVHVQVALARLKRRYGITVDTEPEKVAYREALRSSVQTEGRHKKQSGGHGQFGIAVVRFEPLDRNEGFEFVDETRGGVVPKSLVPAVGKGIGEAMHRHGSHGFALVDLRAVLVDGKHHSVDSDEFSFKMAGALALRAAIDKVGTIVLEPVNHVEVTVPNLLQGDVMADLSRRRGQIEGTDIVGSEEVTVIASVPASELVDYAVALRSMTHGRGRYTLAFKCYQERP